LSVEGRRHGRAIQHVGQTRIIIIAVAHRRKETPVIDRLDHLVLTTAHEDACIRFYTEVLGMTLESFVGGTPPVERKAFGSAGRRSTCTSRAASSSRRQTRRCRARSISASSPRAPRAGWSGCAPSGTPIVEGPVMRTGATAKIRSVYVRDPDLN
jgi:catechol 2,3-dioxygenase-like lactoylglutathione lyase family enzyme